MNITKHLTICVGSVLLSSLLAASSGSVSVSPNPVGEGDTATATADTAPVPPDKKGESCCNGTSTFRKDGDPIYEWSGDATGTGLSASVDTSLDSPGEKRTKIATVTAIQNYVCGEGPETTSSTESASGTFEVWPVCGGEMFDSENFCCVNDEIVEKGQPPLNFDPPPNGSSFREPDTVVTARAYEPWGFLYYLQKDLTADVTNRQMKSRYTLHTNRQSGTCGAGISSIELSDSGSISAGASYRGVSVSLSYSWAYDTTLFSGESTGKANIWKFGAAHNEQRTWVHQDFHITLTETLKGPPQPPAPQVFKYFLSRSYPQNFQTVGITYKVNEVTCCEDPS